MRDILAPTLLAAAAAWIGYLLARRHQQRQTRRALIRQAAQLTAERNRLLREHIVAQARLQARTANSRSSLLPLTAELLLWAAEMQKADD